VQLSAVPLNIPPPELVTEFPLIVQLETTGVASEQ